MNPFLIPSKKRHDVGDNSTSGKWSNQKSWSGKKSVSASFSLQPCAKQSQVKMYSWSWSGVMTYDPWQE